MTDPWDVSESSDTTPKRRGRPKGSRNKPPETLLTLEKLESLYNRVKPYLPDDQRRYIEGVLSGEQDVNPLAEMKLLVRQMSILFSEASVWHFDNKRVTKEFADFANTLRAAIKDLNDLLIKDQEAQAKESDKTDDMVRVTERGAALERLEALLREYPSE